MKNKKAFDADPMKLVIGAAILGIVLFVVVVGVIPIITGKQIPFFKGQTQYTTEDCDGDGAIGINDKCPCGAEDSEGKCIVADSSISVCPDLCKKPKTEQRRT